MLRAAYDIFWIAVTVRMEAEGTSFLGKEMVAHVIMNRAEAERKSVTDVIFAPFQFSAWNTKDPTRLRLDEIMDSQDWRDSLAAACGAYFRKVLGRQDPTKGATHYLNEKSVQKATGKLPDWFDPAKVTAREGGHTFLKLM